jgi:Cytochrome P460
MRQINPKPGTALFIVGVLAFSLADLDKGRGDAPEPVQEPPPRQPSAASVCAHQAAPSAEPAVQASPAAPQPKPSPLPLPHTLPLVEYEKLLYAFLRNFEYDQQRGHLGWARDKVVFRNGMRNGTRDTGDFLKRVDYSTHHAVRIYYSPEVIAWLNGGRKGTIPDGAMIVKEQFPSPAARYAGLEDGALATLITDRTVMVRDSKASKDGWFWAEYFDSPQSPQTLDSHENMAEEHLRFPWSGFGQYCIRCHASAERELTFVDTRSIEGYPGNPLEFRVDDSWKTNEPEAVKISVQHGRGRSVALDETIPPPSPPQAQPDPNFLAFFNEIASVPANEVVRLPDQTHDRVHADAAGPVRFFSSDQCMPCHAGLGTPYGAMYVSSLDGSLSVPYARTGVNVSPYGEWRWSMMGLSGRDPIFYAQLETESNVHKKHKASIIHSCFSCHGVMGQRQNCQDITGHIEAPPDDENLPNDALFKREYVHIAVPKTEQEKRLASYGALARDGVSCMVCHRMQDTRKPLGELISGNFELSKEREIFGPYRDQDITPYHMKTALDLTPRHSTFLKSARLCAACHVVRLPVYKASGEQAKGPDGKPKFAIEQATYLEWLNSDYENEVRPASPTAQTCQQCHMRGDHQGVPLKQRVAIVEDATYPAAGNRAPDDKIFVRDHPQFSRHELQGINLFALQMFNQFSELLGVNAAQDFMTGSTTDLAAAIRNATIQAGRATAEVKLTIKQLDFPRGTDAGRLVASVRVTNKAGHRLPSGVGFRRAFLEFLVIDASGGGARIAWSSGRTNELGVIVDGQGKPLRSETFSPDPSRGLAGDQNQAYQPHYQQITAQDEVQIYEEVARDPERRLTTSFLAINSVAKDNRLLPKGWSKKGPPGLNLAPELLEATHPDPETIKDADFTDGTGSDTLTYELPLVDTDGSRLIRSGDPKDLMITATLYYQSIPPYYLKMRFRDAQGEDTRRLYYLASNLQLRGTDIEGWKLRIAQASAKGPVLEDVKEQVVVPGRSARLAPANLR